MFGGLNWIDGVIILLLIGAVIGSFRIGFFIQTLVIAGFFGALFLGGWLFPHVIPVQDRTLRTIINVNLVLGGATYAAFKGLDIGQKLHLNFSKGKFKLAESIFGLLPGLAASLIAIWLLAAMFGRLPFVGFSNSVSDALIVQSLSRRLPDVPAVFAVFNRQVNPNSPPELFVDKPEPQPSFNFSPGAVESATAKTKMSMVRITGFGCGGVEAGSGFAVGKNLVATNAHVVAGIKRPIIKYDGHSYEAVPVLFNSGLDIAVLRVTTTVHDFKAPALPLADASAKEDTTVAVLGYPGGNFAAIPGIIRNDLVVRGRNIYDLGVVRRNIYEVQTNVSYGSSGGPVVLGDGKVAGMVISKYDLVDNYAMALTSLHLKDEIRRAENSHRRVSTGSCLAG
jgi:S1-C subfamily serine protease